VAAIHSPLPLAQHSGNIEEIVITSSRVAIPLRQLGTSVSVMDEFEIESRGVLNLTDLLRQMPATGASSNGGAGKPTTVRIRGEEGFRTLTILDGMRIQDPSGPQIATSFEHLLSDGIGRIEVLRGPQGLAYGADAGGVINMSSRSTAEGFSATADAQTGRYGTNQLAANIAGRSGTVDYFLAVTDFETNGFNSRDSDSMLMDADGYENTTLHARLGFDITEEFRVQLVHRNVDSRNEFDGCFTATRVEDCSDSNDLSATRLEAEYKGTGFSHSISYNSTDSDRESFAGGASSFTAAGELERSEYLGSATDLPGFDLVFGGDQEKASNNGMGRDNTGMFLEYLSDFSDAIFLTAGVRHDDNEDFGTNTNYRVSAAYLVDLEGGTLKFKSALGTGFRAPSPFEIAYNAGPFASSPAADIALQQEESEGWEIGVEYFTSTMRLEAVYFDQDIENAIFFDLAAFSGYLQDIGQSNSKGIELSAEVPITDSLRVTGNYTHNETERPDGTQRLRRPENLFNLGFLYTGLDGKLNLNGFYRSQADAIDSGNIAIDDFGVFDLTASYQLTESFQVYGRLENSFDEDYQEIIDYNAAGAAAYIGVSFNLTR
jgi:vitamin B12 transporter